MARLPKVTRQQDLQRNRGWETPDPRYLRFPSGSRPLAQMGYLKAIPDAPSPRAHFPCPERQSGHFGNPLFPPEKDFAQLRLHRWIHRQRVDSKV
ncbi:MAG: hypothetical protein CMP27_12975 [Roseibacillus sp.]|nr:hypothetical protein [Roseibacillus sp.]